MPQCFYELPEVISWRWNLIWLYLLTAYWCLKGDLIIFKTHSLYIHDGIIASFDCYNEHLIDPLVRSQARSHFSHVRTTLCAVSSEKYPKWKWGWNDRIVHLGFLWFAASTSIIQKLVRKLRNICYLFTQDGAVSEEEVVNHVDIFMRATQQKNNTKKRKPKEELWFNTKN